MRSLEEDRIVARNRIVHGVEERIYPHINHKGKEEPIKYAFTETGKLVILTEDFTPQYL